MVADTGNTDVVEMPATATSSSQWITLPFTGLSGPQGLAVDANGDVFVADTGNNRVAELPAGSSTQQVLPFTGLRQPTSVGVDAAGDVFTVVPGVVLPPAFNAPAVVHELPAGSGTQRTMTAGAVGATGTTPPVLTVDPEGDVFIAGTGLLPDGGSAGRWSISTIPAGATGGGGLGWIGSNDAAPSGIAVDPDGDLLVALPNTAQIQDITGISGVPQPQSVSITSSPPSPAVYGGSYTLSAAGGASGNPVTFTADSSSTSGACAVSGDTVSFTGTGTCVIDANQAAGDGYNASRSCSARQPRR